MANIKKIELDPDAIQGKYLTFQLMGEIYGLQILKVQEIISLLNITRVPRTPHYVLGVINLRGKVIPVIDMRLKFGLEKSERTERTCIIVVQITRGQNSITIGIIVDEVSEVMNVKGSQISPTPPMGASVNTDFIMGMGKVEDSVIMLLDIDKAFSDEIFSVVEAQA